MTITAEELPAPRRPFLVEMDAAARQQREEARVQAFEAFAAEAQEHGYCVECWARSTHYGYYPAQGKKVRHRLRRNCPHARRRNS